MKLYKNQNYSLDQLSDCIKILSADAVESAKSGHPGLPLGFAQIMTCLVFEFLKFNPLDAKWFNRDRLILSAGHGSMLLYSFFYLTGYSNFSLEEIKNFRQLGSKAAGHPEHHLFDGIETTTGPLGQGIANAVGTAIAAKKYEAELGKNICNYKTYVIAGDGCLMEGISYEALSLAGYLKLNNLIVLFDDNGISIDGKTSLTISEDQMKKFDAMGFDTYKVDGHDCEEICAVLDKVRNASKPSFIAFKTIIAAGTKNKAGSEKSHGSPLGEEEISFLKSNIVKNNPDFAGDKFYIPESAKQAWENAWLRNKTDYESWQKSFSALPASKQKYLDKTNLIISPELERPTKPEATRVSSGKIIENLIKNNDKIIYGSADLTESNVLTGGNRRKIITGEDFSGNFIHYGIREHAMAAIMNGLALSGFSPIGGTFLVFSDYMRPAIRLAALTNLPVIFVMTHDSVGLGEDGPTHQPIEHLASLRAMPNINIFRPADFTEVKECYEVAVQSQKPAIIALSRQAVPQIRQDLGENKAVYGGYIISPEHKTSGLDFTIFATGSEVSIAIEVQNMLKLHDLSVRVCSVPCFDILIKNKDYLNILKGGAKKLAAIEAACNFGWAEIIGPDGEFFGINEFGRSAPADILYEYFGLNAKSIAEKLLEINKQI